MASAAFGLLISLAAMVGGVFMFLIGLLGRVPHFVGPPRAVEQAARTSVQGRLACLAAGPLFVIIGLLTFHQGCNTLVYGPKEPTAERRDVPRLKPVVDLPAKDSASALATIPPEQRDAFVALLSSPEIWQAEQPDKFRNRLTGLTVFQQENGTYNVSFAVESGQRGAEFSDCKFTLSLGVDDRGIYASGPGNMSKNGGRNPSTFELRPDGDKLKYRLLFANTHATDGVLSRKN